MEFYCFLGLKKALNKSLGLPRLQYPWQTPLCAVAEGFKSAAGCACSLRALRAEGLHVVEGGTVCDYASCLSGNVSSSRVAAPEQ